MKHILILIIKFIVIIQLTASNNVDVKVEMSHVTCNLESSTIYMHIFIKKSEEATQDIYLKNQNYRMEFNAQSLLEGSFFIESEGDLFSGFNTNPDGSVYLFGEHNLIGTKANSLSYNIDYQGGNGALHLQKDWVLVGTIGGTLLTNIECINSNILTVGSVPPTTFVYSYSVSNSSDIVIDQNPSVYNLTSCIQSYCNLCSQNLSLIQDQNNYVSGEILEHKVSDFIEASNVVGKKAQITLNTKNYGILEAGFEVQNDASFEIKIEGCQN